MIKVRFGLIGDIHGNLKHLQQTIKKLEKHKIDALFVTGDIAGTVHYPLIINSILKYKTISREKYVDLVYGEAYHRFTEFQQSTVESALSMLSRKAFKVFFTHGNSETKEARELMNTLASENDNLFYLGNDVVELENIQVVGYGYCMPAEYRQSFKTPGEKKIEEIEKDLQQLESRISHNDKLLIGLFHEPPNNVKVDYIPQKKVYGGNPIINKHIAKVKYRYFFSGHIHESQGYAKVGDTIVVNPGALVESEWAVVDETSQKIHFFKKKFNPSVLNFIYKTRKLFA